tara:strand:+ start:6506 stop:7438 length:933 start_codon:yes stop_codon:yes gene_type:complete
MKIDEQTEPYQKEVRKKHKKMKIKLIGKGGNKYSKGPYSEKPDYERSKSAPPSGKRDEIQELNEAIHAFFGYDQFNLKDELNQKFWKNPEKLDSRVRQILVKIGKDFFKTLEVDAELIDITFTGSLANYNYADESDIDLHILLDFKKIDHRFTFLKDYFTSKKNDWNRKHDIKIKGFEVEVYAQDVNEPHASTGVYSLLYDRWATKPTKKKIKVDSAAVYKKAAAIGNAINDVHALFSIGNYEQAHADAERLMEKIKKFRRCGLETGGEFSSENLAFKSLRRSGYLEKLSKIKTNAYDEMMSIAAKRDTR